MAKNKVIVATSDFQCFYVKRRPAAYVGKQIEFTDEEVIKNRPALIKLVLVAACISILFTLGFLNIININDTLFAPKVFAYVDVDINPSLEMEIDDMGNVLKLVPLNEDAKVLINKIKLDRISVSKAINDIIDEVKKNKAVSEKDSVLVSSTLNHNENDKVYRSGEEKLNTIINSLKKDIQKNSKVNICILQANMNERKDAQSKGISTGRYLLYNKYKNFNTSFSIEEAKTTNINELLKGLSDNKEEKNTPQNTASPAPSPLKNKDATQTWSPVPSGNPAQEKETSSDSNNTTKLNTQPASPLPSPAIKTANSPFMRFESYNYHGRFIRHQSFIGHISDNVTPFDDSVFKMVPGLSDKNCISFESKNFPGYYLRHKNFKIILEKCDDSTDFKECATFKKVSGFADKNSVSFQSYNYPKRYIRHKDFFLQIDEISSDLDKKDATFIEIKFK